MTGESGIARGTRAAGKLGEDAACQFLERGKGHRIAARNWRSGHREVDIVSIDPDGNLHFVEVKTRLEPLTAEPYEQVDAHKRRNIEMAARAWLSGHHGPQLPSAEVFFDIVSVVYGGDRFDIDYIPQAWIPMQL